jgi:hypothetical protein
LKQYILAEPKRYNQGVQIEKVDPERKENPTCGTVGCLLGWASFLAKKSAKKTFKQCQVFSFNVGRKYLGLSKEQAKRLYSMPNEYGDYGWSRKYQDAYLKAKTPAGRVRVAARVIDRLVKTNGEDF